MARGGKCPRGFICSDRTTLWIVVIGVAVLVLGAWWYGPTTASVAAPPPEQKIILLQAPAPVGPPPAERIRPDLYPEPVQRISVGIPPIAVRGPAGPYQQVGILTAEGGSSSSASPDRTILPLYGRELDPRRGRWNYYTRTDGANPVQVPVRVRNRVCDDDSNGCDEVGSDDSVHVPALGRSFKATVYRKSIFG
jgi:hypothetical protein